MLNVPVEGSQDTELRFERAAAAAILVTRAGYSLYAVGVVGLNVSQYERPGLAEAMVGLALAGSTLLGFVVLKQGAVAAWLAIADASLAGLVLAGVSLALAPVERAGSLNWALAYSVGCAIWLGYSRQLWLGVMLAVILSAVYLRAALSGVANAEPALTVTAIVNAMSPVLYFGLAALVFRLMRTLAIRTDQLHAEEKRQRRGVIELEERERLFHAVHEPVTEALSLVADAAVDEREVRDRARLGAWTLRRTMTALGGAVAKSPLRERLNDWATSCARRGQRVAVIDEELFVEPSAKVVEAVMSALETLVPKDRQIAPSIRARLASDERGMEVGLRWRAEPHRQLAPVAEVRTLLAPVRGTINLRPGLDGELSVILKVPP
jgi:hypothetical protein